MTTPHITAEFSPAALEVVPGLLDDGWAPAEAVYRALEDSVDITLDQWQEASDEARFGDET